MSRRSTDCPGCGAPIVWVLYVPAPENLRAGQKRKRVPLDAAPVADDDEYAQHAASPGMTTCRRITPDEPLIGGLETRHTIHHATHPECSDHLRGTPGRTTT
ncbi:hypothetical protein [Cellulosimicrobium sp. I38E]|uniref:hypothetical protein n=1 Tax=Cellulosimicrobium sp. I38E TaxID=1393139 RepID=UPI0007B27EE0|nr:hypothetical protein [Cellulosimicrobium sp. I38E]KZM78377.1 hypothetical protein A0J59_13675 [Cellulosimicrobium sp. I38E]